jgi:hypothetical protein
MPDGPSAGASSHSSVVLSTRPPVLSASVLVGGPLITTMGATGALESTHVCNTPFRLHERRAGAGEALPSVIVSERLVSCHRTKTAARGGAGQAVVCGWLGSLHYLMLAATDYFAAVRRASAPRRHCRLSESSL